MPKNLGLLRVHRLMSETSQDMFFPKILLHFFMSYVLRPHLGLSNMLSVASNTCPKLIWFTYEGFQWQRTRVIG